MKTSSRFIRSSALILIGALSLLISCSFEQAIPVPGPSAVGETADIPFLARIPAATAVATRGETGTAPENRIDEIHVLVFRTTGELVYKGKGKNMQASGTHNNTVAFRATLPVGAAYDFMVLANAGSLLEEIAVGAAPAKTKTDVEALVQQAATIGPTYQNWDGPIPMWDEQRLELTASSSPVFYLTRMLARINVEYNPAAGTDDLFRLTDIRYYNYNTRGRVVPPLINLTGSGAGRQAIRPTLPDDPGTQLEKALEYTRITDYKTCKNRIYVFEAAHQGPYNAGGDAWVGNPCLVVGGKYDTDEDGQFDEEPTGWYRIDFIKKPASGGDGDWLSLLRNFSYNVVITSVSGTGYSDPDVALRSAPLNMAANVIDWNDGRMDEVIFDGTAYLSVDRHELLLPRHAVDTELADGSNLLRIKTDYTVNGYPAHSGWKAEYFTDPQGTAPMADPWLQLVNGDKINQGAPTGTPDDPAAETHFTFSENTGTGYREAWVYITAGRLRYRVHVVQKLLSIDLFEAIGGVETPKDSMLFVVPHAGHGDRDHAPRTFRVHWRPVGKAVRATHQAPVAWNPFDPNRIMDMTSGGYPLPAPNGEWSFTDTNGVREFTVDPPTVPDEELDRDPFYEKRSTYWFEIDNNGETEQKGITLHQVYYNIVVDTYKYRLDGSTATITVRSNTEWEITQVEECLYNEDPITTTPGPLVMLALNPYDNLKVGTTGGPFVTGESVAFTTVNAETTAHQGKWGTVYVTFESPTGKFPPQRVPLIFPPKGRLLLGLGFSQDVRAYNVAFASSYHGQGANRMLANPLIFGPSDESIVKVEGLHIIGYNSTGLSSAVPTINPEANWHTGYLKKWINLHRPDVIVISYNIRFNANECALIKKYLDNQGTVIAMYNGGGAGNQSAVKTFMEAIFPGRTFTTGYDGYDNNTDIRNWGGLPATGALFKLAEGPGYEDEPILNGPFGDIRGRYWGAHYYRSGILASAIADQAHILSTAKSLWPSPNDSGHDDYAIMFRHKTLNLFFVGCSGFTASYYPWYEQTGFDGEQCKDPFRVDESNNFMPKVRGSFNAEGVFVRPATPGVDVYNSFVFANAAAWALSSSRYHHPSNDYADCPD